MIQDFIIRNERKEDYRAVEELTRNAFWNLYVPGCDEHYLVHIMREHCDFIPELDFVIEVNQRIIGNVMYTKSWLTDEDGNEKAILTFGPISIHTDYQRQGYGKVLLEASFKKAVEIGYDTIVIMGSPANYVSRGFFSCIRYNVSLEEGIFPTALLVKELIPGALKDKRWIYRDSELYSVDEQEAEKFDQNFDKWEKKCKSSQEEFYILSNSRIHLTEEKTGKTAADSKLKISEGKKCDFLKNLDRLHTTELGIVRIKTNLGLDSGDVVEWCRKKAVQPESIIVRRGKNWYILVEGCEITVNAYSYTIITAHKRKG